MERPGHTPEQQGLPEPLPVNFAAIPERLREYHQWVVWKYASVDEEIKKSLYNPTTGRLASVRNPDTWGSVQQAQAAYETGQFSGVGIVLTADMGIVGVDIDHCVENGQVNENASRIIAALHSYTELSPSETGIRIMLEGKLPGIMRRRGAIELYEDLRYLTLTGQHLAQTPNDIQPRHKELYGMYQRLFPVPRNEDTQENTGVGDTHRPAYQLARTDQEVLQKAQQARNGENFKRYYTGDASLWEGAGAKHTSQSEADFTLVLMLLYWTNNDPIQVDRLFRQSGLMRQKWTQFRKGSETYGNRIIYDAMRKGNH